ncbi:MAG: hypothetical protein GC192_02510 [Bacteroidetes bacterium]|nr:hypothetical protein [Bacteroidota bacterium]
MFLSKRKSGNGTSSRQWLYLYVNIPLIILVKLGVSGDFRRRAKQVGKKSIGWVVPIFAVKIPFAWHFEQSMHRFFRLFNVKYGGSKEWYFFPIIPFAITIMLLAFLLEWVILLMLFILLLWYFQR